MKRVYCWLFPIMIGFIPALLVSADDDDYLETLEDASGEPLNTDMSYYNDRKRPPVRLTGREEIEWGEFDDRARRVGR